jgi:RNA polymerase sigma-70 factor (ECF subfamily)
LNSTAADEHRFLELVNENRNRILKVCRVYAWNPCDQEDLYQEILFQIWRALPGLKDNTYANTWLYRIAINTSITFTRKRAARGGRPLQLNDAELTRHIEARQAQDRQPAENVAKLYEAIAQLEPVERALITLFLEDLSYEQIADVLGVSANNVGVMLHRAKKKLSALMTEAAHE